MVRFPLEEKYYSIFRSFATHHDVFTMSSKFGRKWTDVSQWEPNVLTLGSQVVFPASYLQYLLRFLCRMQSETKKTQKKFQTFSFQVYPLVQQQVVLALVDSEGLGSGQHNQLQDCSGLLALLLLLLVPLVRFKLRIYNFVHS